MTVYSRTIDGEERFFVGAMAPPDDPSLWHSKAEIEASIADLEAANAETNRQDFDALAERHYGHGKPSHRTTEPRSNLPPAEAAAMAASAMAAGKARAAQREEQRANPAPEDVSDLIETIDPAAVYATFNKRNPNPQGAS
jgi:hypothetical protein